MSEDWLQWGEKHPVPNEPHDDRARLLRVERARRTGRKVPQIHGYSDPTIPSLLG